MKLKISGYLGIWSLVDNKGRIILTDLSLKQLEEFEEYVKINGG